MFRQLLSCLLPLSVPAQKRGTQSSETNDTIVKVEEFESRSRVADVQAILKKLILCSIHLTSESLLLQPLLGVCAGKGLALGIDRVNLVQTSNDVEGKTREPESRGILSNLVVVFQLNEFDTVCLHCQ